MKNRIKRTISLALALCMTLMLAACASGHTSSNPPGGSAPVIDGSQSGGPSYKGQWIRNTSSSMGGIWYPMAVAMNLIWEENLNGISCKVVTGSSTENVRLVANSETEVGWCHSVAIVDAFNGVAPYDDGKDYSNIGHISTIHPSAIHVFATKSSGITSLADLNGKNVGFGNAGSTSTVVSMQLLEQEYGITEASIVAAGGTVAYSSNSDAITMLQDRQLDVYFSQSTYPSTDIAELESELTLVPIDADKLENFLTNNDKWLPCTIPGGSYTNQPNDYLTLASYVMCAVPLSMSEQQAYDMTKSMWENVEQIWEASADAKAFMSLDIAVICKDIVPLHPGAERYYKEIGVL
ncbi:TAXI family TRAP transporter solute-binding subunit [Oscillospiraceae bacterium 44-5]